MNNLYNTSKHPQLILFEFLPKMLEGPEAQLNMNVTFLLSKKGVAVPNPMLEGDKQEELVAVRNIADEVGTFWGDYTKEPVNPYLVELWHRPFDLVDNLAAREVLAKRFPDQTLYLGMDLMIGAHVFPARSEAGFLGPALRWQTMIIQEEASVWTFYETGQLAVSAISGEARLM